MKNTIAVIFCFFILFLFGACGTTTESYGGVSNYMQSLSLLSCGDFLVKTENSVPCIFDENGNSYTIIDNAVKLSEAGVMRVLHADSDSFFIQLLRWQTPTETETVTEYTDIIRKPARKSWFTAMFP